VVNISLETIPDINIANDIVWNVPWTSIRFEVFLPCFGDVLKAIEKIPYVRYRNTGIIVQHLAVRHITDHTQLIKILAKLRSNDVTRLLLIGGSKREHAMFDSCLALLNHIDMKTYGITHVYFAGHPEGHDHMEDPIDQLKTKIKLAQQQGYETGVVSQFCFNETKIIEWVKQVEQFLPREQIKIGVVGPTNIAKMIQIARICGVHLPISFLLSKLPKLILGRHLANGVLNKVLAYAPTIGVHVYTMGRPEYALNWILSEIKK